MISSVASESTVHLGRELEACAPNDFLSVTGPPKPPKEQLIMLGLLKLPAAQPGAELRDIKAATALRQCRTRAVRSAQQIVSWPMLLNCVHVVSQVKLNATGFQCVCVGVICLCDSAWLVVPCASRQACEGSTKRDRWHVHLCCEAWQVPGALAAYMPLHSGSCRHGCSYKRHGCMHAHVPRHA